MAIRREILSEGEFYHLYSRGTDKRKIFLDENDRKRFLRLMFLCNSNLPVSYRGTKRFSLKELNLGEQLISIGAYCLMPNHFHMVVKEENDGGIVKFMRKFLTAYSAYFNKKYERTGNLFGSRFKSSHLATDKYLKYIFSYIHLNPLKMLDSNWKERKFKIKEINNYLDHYKYSSYLDYIEPNSREEFLILNTAVFPQYFSNQEEFKAELYSWLTEDGPR